MDQEITGRLIRQYVDGELPAAQTAMVERALAEQPALREQVAFERSLRDHVGAVMTSTCPGAPGSLRSQVSGVLAAADAAETVPEVHVAGRIEPSAPGATSTGTGGAPWWMGPQRMSAVAIAATVLLVTAVVLVSIFTPPIDEWGTPSRTDFASVTDVADYVAGEHVRCAGNEKALRHKAHYQTPEEAHDVLVSHLGNQFKVFDLSDSVLGYRFVGAGECAAPGADRSCHLIYLRERPGELPAKLSVFIEPDEGQFRECAGACDWKVTDCRTGLRNKVVYGTDGDLVYFLVCCDNGDLRPVAEAIRRQLSERE